MAAVTPPAGTGNAESPDNTGNTGNTGNPDNTESTGNTESPGNPGNTGNTATRARINAEQSRTASNSLLAVLLDGGFRPHAWMRFLDLAIRRSVHQARLNPRPLLESTAIHVIFALLARRRGLLWVGISWIMVATHLGMLGDRRSLGLPNALTLIRGNLPAIAPLIGRSLPILSLATDFADGKIARATANVTPFGSQADYLADTAFWTWFVVRHEPSRIVVVGALAAWALPVAAIAAASIRRGRVLEVPRSVWFRPAAAMEAVLGTRAILRNFRPR